MRAIILAALAALGACAHAAPTLMPPTFDIAPGMPVPQAQLYGDCISQSTAARSYDRAGGLIRFHCGGAPAQAFFDALAGYSAANATEYRANGLTWRFTQSLEHNPEGLDFCTRADADGASACTLIFNAGAFVRQ